MGTPMEGTLIYSTPPPRLTYVCCVLSGAFWRSGRLFSRVERIEEVRVKSMWPVSEQVLGVVVK